MQHASTTVAGSLVFPYCLEGLAPLPSRVRFNLKEFIENYDDLDYVANAQSGGALHTIFVAEN